MDISEKNIVIILNIEYITNIDLNLIFDIQFSQIKVISKKIRFETKLQVYSNLTQLQYLRAFMRQQ